MEGYFFLVMYVLCPVLGWWTASWLASIRLEESSVFRNILLTRSTLSELSMDVFASENSKRSWFLCLEIGGDEWHLAKLAVYMRWWGNTALHPDVLFYTRSAFIVLCRAVSIMQPDIFKSGKSYTRLHVPLETELISSPKDNHGALCWFHILMLWSWISYPCSNLTNNSKQRGFSSETRISLSATHHYTFN